MKRVLSIACRVAVIVSLCGTAGYAVETAATAGAKKAAAPVKAQAAAPAKAQAAKPEEKKAAPAKEYSREEMIALLNEKAKDNPDMTSAVQGLVIKEAGGKKSVEYMGKRLEDLDKDTLKKLFTAVNRYLVMKNAERIQRQLKSIEQINRLNRAQQVAGPPSVPTIPKMPAQQPRTQMPPKLPSAPRTPGK